MKSIFENFKCILYVIFFINLFGRILAINASLINIVKSDKKEIDSKNLGLFKPMTRINSYAWNGSTNKYDNVEKSGKLNRSEENTLEHIPANRARTKVIGNEIGLTESKKRFRFLKTRYNQGESKVEMKRDLTAHSVETDSPEDYTDNSMDVTQEDTNNGVFKDKYSYQSRNPNASPVFKAPNSEFKRENISDENGAFSNIPVYVKHRIREEILAKPSEREEVDSSLVQRVRDSVLKQFDLYPMHRRPWSSSNGQAAPELITKGRKSVRSGTTQADHALPSGTIYNFSSPRPRNASWYVYMNCSRDLCIWSNSSNATDLTDEGWVLHNCSLSGAGCTGMNPGGSKSESSRDFIRVLLLVGSLCILKVLVFVVVFYYCKGLKTSGRYRGFRNSIRSFFGSDGGRYPEDEEEAELMIGKNIGDENGLYSNRSSKNTTKPFRPKKSSGEEKQKRNDDSLSPEGHHHHHQKHQRNSRVWSPPLAISPELRETYATGDSFVVHQQDQCPKDIKKS